MILDHDTAIALETAVDLVNTVDGRTGHDVVADPVALRTFLVEHSMSAVGALTAADVAAVRGLRERLRDVFAAPDVATAATVVNELFVGTGALPQLTDHDGTAWHLHFHPPGAGVPERVQVESAMALAVVLRDDGIERLRTCAAPDCANVLVDLSRNRSRRYCDAQGCGNRLHVAAYRARRRAGSG